MTGRTTEALLPLPLAPSREQGVFWKPSGQFISDLAVYLRGKRVLEIFAGNGYLAAWLSREGVDLTATSYASSHDGHELGYYYPVIDCGAVDAVEKFSEGCDVLLLSWPTVTDAALQAVTKWGTGRPIVFIGEVTDHLQGHLGGCATDEFFEAVEPIHRFESYDGRWHEHAFVYLLKSTVERVVPAFMRDPHAYFDNTVHVDLSSDLRRFTSALPPAGKIVDAGCGSGRDTKWLIEHGFSVYAYDPHIPLAEMAEQYLAKTLPGKGLTVYRHTHQELAEHLPSGSVDAILASASVIFDDNLGLAATLRNFSAVLSPKGRVYASFKSGAGWKDGSRHLMPTHDYMLERLCPSLRVVDTWLTEDALGRGNRWTVFILEKDV